MTGDYRNLTVGHVITYASLSTLLTLYNSPSHLPFRDNSYKT